MEDWISGGLSARLIARLGEAAIADDDALRSWLAAHPTGDGRIGRVMLIEIENYLAARPQEP